MTTDASDTEVATMIGEEKTSPATPADGDNDGEEVVNFLINDENSKEKLVFDLVCDVAETLLGWTWEGTMGLQN